MYIINANSKIFKTKKLYMIKHDKTDQILRDW